MSPTEGGPDFGAVDRPLREVLAPLRSRLVATRDGPDGLALEIPGSEGKPWGYVAGFERYLALAADVAREKATPGVR